MQYDCWLLIRGENMEREKYIAKDMKEEFDKLVAVYPDCGLNKLEDLCRLPNSKHIVSYWNLGIPLYKAYGMVYADEIYDKRLKELKEFKVGDIRNRKGIVSLSRELLMNMDIDLASKLFAKLIIIKTEYKYETDIIDYYARSKDFEEVEIGSKPPKYLVSFENDGINFEKA